MAITHLSSGQIASVLPLGGQLENAKTTAFFKDEQLEVMRIILPAGKKIAPHAVNGPITIQCLEGEVNVELESRHQLMRAGDLLYLAAAEKHALTSNENASLLVTVALRPA